MKIVSAVIVCHNNIKDTVRCVDHVFNSNAKFQVILVDNASKDATPEWAAKKKDMVYLQNQVNLGCAIGRNLGAKWARAEHILFLDNDQFIPPDYISRLLKLKRHIVGCEHWEVFSSDGMTRRRQGTLITSRSYIGSGGMLVDRAVFNRLGGYDERYAPAWYEDVDFCFRARNARFTMGVLEDHGVEHIGGGTSKVQKTYDFAKAKTRSRALFTFIWQSVLRAPISFITDKPVIYMAADVKGWAWDMKAKQIQKYLSDEFDIRIVYTSHTRDMPARNENDLWFIFEPFQHYVELTKGRYITGVTAHTYVNMANWEKYLQSAVAIHANSKLLYNEISTLNNNCFYVPNGVDEDLFEFNPRGIGSEFTVGYVGKDKPRKGLQEYIIPACEKAGVKLKIQKGKYNSENYIKHYHMAKFYHDIDAIMVASDMDGTPNQLLEAASVGRTFIGCKIGNVPEFVDEGKNGFMVERNVDEYAKMLVFLKENRKKCRQMGENARRTVETGWTWKLQAENYRTMFKKVM